MTPVQFFWCHTWGCPEFSRARALPMGTNTQCPYCQQDRKMVSPDDHALHSHVPGEAA